MERNSEEWKRKERELRERRHRQENERRIASGLEPLPPIIPEDESHSVNTVNPLTEEPSSEETVEVPVSVLERLTNAIENQNQNQMAQRQQDGLDTETINQAAKSQLADAENQKKAKDRQQIVHAIVMLPVLIGLMIAYGWWEWMVTLNAWLVIVPWYCVCWVCGKIAYGIVRSNR